MLTLDELSQNVAAYQQQRMSLEDFENWFEDNSSGAYEVPGLREACTAVDAALSEYYYDHIGEDALKAELANAVRPFAERPLSWEKHPLGVFVLKNIDASTAVVGTVGTVGEWDWSPELWPYAVAESQGQFQVAEIKTEVARKPMASATSASLWYREQVALPV